MNSDWRGDVLGFWFALNPRQWWTADARVDAEVAESFARPWTELRRLPPQSFLDEPLSALAAVLLFDQVPRNMFRGHAEQFATDALALAVAKGAVDHRLDEPLEPAERGFLYMPFQHSEALADQNRGLLLFTELGDGEMLNYAGKHRDIIARFGRFPHRNAMLGRSPRGDEIAAGDVVPW